MHTRAELLIFSPQRWEREEIGMFDQGAIVTYKDFGMKLAGYCGIVEGIVKEQPDHVWVRWVGESAQKKESMAELEIL